MAVTNKCYAIFLKEKENLSNNRGNPDWKDVAYLWKIENILHGVSSNLEVEMLGLASALPQ